MQRLGANEAKDDSGKDALIANHLVDSNRISSTVAQIL